MVAQLVECLPINLLACASMGSNPVEPQYISSLILKLLQNVNTMCFIVKGFKETIQVA